MGNDVSRRDFLKDAAVGAAGMAAMGMLVPTGAYADPYWGTDSDATNATSDERVTVELPIPDTYDADLPDQTDYEVDVLIIGGGYAGINAAYAAKQSGANVLLVDKGRPGFSGQSPWPGTFNFFDPDMGDDATAFREYIRYTSEYMGNLDLIDEWIAESKDTYKRIASWGLVDQYTRMCETDYFKTRDYYGYRDNVVGDHERRPKFVKMLDDNGIPWLQHVMINNVIVQDGKAVGAVGYQFTTGAIITFHAKAIVMAMGNGCITATGHPIGDNTYDGEFIAYNLGLPIAGKEFEDFHTHQSFAPGNNWIGSDARYFDPNFLCGGNITLENVQKAKADCDGDGKTKQPTSPDGLEYIDSISIDDEIPTKGGAQSVVWGTNPDEVRCGKIITPYVKFDAPGAAVGMCLHNTSGVFCGLDDTDGATPIPGLYVAGDGIHAMNIDGGNYSCGNGFTSCMQSIDGYHAGTAAASYCGGVDLERMTDENIQAATDEINQPLTLDTGFSPMWARDVLQGIMAPYWVMKNKTEETLSAALVQVQYMQDHVAPRLLARSPHQVRIALEMKHKIQASILKLNAALARKESRGGNFYRDDYPERDDENFAGYITQTKGENGEIEMDYVPVKEEWTAAGIPADYEV